MHMHFLILYTAHMPQTTHIHTLHMHTAYPMNHCKVLLSLVKRAGCDRSYKAPQWPGSLLKVWVHPG